MDWDTELKALGALWEHDGHPVRPYALLTSERISGHFADMSFLMARPTMIAAAAKELADKVREDYPDTSTLVICGQQKGSTTLASRIAEELDCDFIFTNKIGEGVDKMMEVDERFAGIVSEDKTALLVEDVTTTASTSSMSRWALWDFGLKNVSNLLLTIVDRTGGNNRDGFIIVSCFIPDDFPTWEEGTNPHTKDGKEIVPPVRPKTKEGRRAMRQSL